jgi:predicted DNA-binding transcriptional regulator YafY
MRASRLLSILDILRGRLKPVTAATLARELEVSERTIHRDMATLRDMGAPLRGEAGVGYQLEPGYFLPPLRFDPEEMDALMLGLRLVAARADPEAATAARRAAARIRAVLPASLGNTFSQTPVRAVSRPSEEGDRALPLLAPLRAAIRDRKRVELAYRDGEDARTRRIVRPLGLTVFDAAWLLTAWCETRDDFRNFRVDRITGLITRADRFPLDRGKRFEDYLATL